MTTTTKIHFFCDESGAKGYADHDETYPGETGVFAGILVPDARLAEVAPTFQAIHDRYKPATGKLHITDLPNNSKQSLRNEIYVAIRMFDLPCFWYAIHVAGLHDLHKKTESALKKTIATQELAGAEAGRHLKRGSPRSDPSSMHTELFTGLFRHVVAFLIERRQANVEIEIQSDQIDSPIIKTFEGDARDLISSATSSQAVTAYDPQSKTILKGKVDVGIDGPFGSDLAGIVQSLKIVPPLSGDGLVLAADVLANSLFYHFNHRGSADLFGELNCPDAVAGHPLSAHLDAFLNWGPGDLVGDRLYRHPKAPPVDA